MKRILHCVLVASALVVFGRASTFAQVDRATLTGS